MKRNLDDQRNTAFFSMLYDSIMKYSDYQMDLFTLNQITHYPLIFTEKLILAFSDSNTKDLTEEQFVTGFITLLFGDNDSKTHLLSKILDFHGNQTININNVKILFIHLHMRLMNDANENTLYSIIDNFFEDKTEMSTDEFITKSFETNGDLVSIFDQYIQNLPFLNEEQFNFLEKQINNKSSSNFVYSKQNSGNIFSPIPFSSSKDCLSIATVPGPSNGQRRSSFFVQNELQKKKMFLLANLDNIGKNSASPEKKQIRKSIDMSVNMITGTQLNAMNNSAEKREERRKLNNSIPAKQYINCIKANNIEKNDDQLLADMIDDDEEMRNVMDSFDNDYLNAKRNLFKTFETITRKETTGKFSASKSDYSENSYAQEEAIDNQMGSAIIRFSAFNSYYVTDSKTKEESGSKLLSTEIESCNININNIQVQIKNNKFDIVCYMMKREGKKLKKVKLSVVYNIIFKFTKSNYSREYILKKFIVITQLYPKINSKITFNKDVEIPKSLKDKEIFHLKILSMLHNYHYTLNLYSDNITDLLTLRNHICYIENLKDLTISYEVSNQIGCGNFGTVFKVTKKSNEREYCVKAVSKNQEEHHVENFKCSQWEKDIFIFLSKVSDRNIVKCFEYFETPNKIFYVFDFIRDGDLRNYILENAVDRPNVELITKLCTQIIKGITTLHRYGIIHRDLKHTNILVKVDAEKNPEAKIIDFGLSKVMGLTETASDKYGTLVFKAPELISSQKAVYSFKVDVWAFGIIAYFMISPGDYPIIDKDRKIIKRNIKNYSFKKNSRKTFLHDDEFLREILCRSLVNKAEERSSIFSLLPVN